MNRLQKDCFLFFPIANLTVVMMDTHHQKATGLVMSPLVLLKILIALAIQICVYMCEAKEVLDY